MRVRPEVVIATMKEVDLKAPKAPPILKKEYVFAILQTKTDLLLEENVRNIFKERELKDVPIWRIRAALLLRALAEDYTKSPGWMVKEQPKDFLDLWDEITNLDQEADIDNFNKFMHKYLRGLVPQLPIHLPLDFHPKTIEEAQNIAEREAQEAMDKSRGQRESPEAVRLEGRLARRAVAIRYGYNLDESGKLIEKKKNE